VHAHGWLVWIVFFFFFQFLSEPLSEELPSLPFFPGLPVIIEFPLTFPLNTRRLDPPCPPHGIFFFCDFYCISCFLTWRTVWILCLKTKSPLSFLLGPMDACLVPEWKCWSFFVPRSAFLFFPNLEKGGLSGSPPHFAEFVFSNFCLAPFFPFPSPSVSDARFPLFFFFLSLSKWDVVPVLFPSVPGVFFIFFAWADPFFSFSRPWLG